MNILEKKYQHQLVDGIDINVSYISTEKEDEQEGSVEILVDIRTNNFSDKVKVDLMAGGQSSIYGEEYVSFDLEEGGDIVDDVANFNKYFNDGTLNKIRVDNPRAIFLNIIAASLVSGGKVIVTGGMSNKFFKNIFNGIASGLEDFKVVEKKRVLLIWVLNSRTVNP